MPIRVARLRNSFGVLTKYTDTLQPGVSQVENPFPAGASLLLLRSASVPGSTWPDASSHSNDGTLANSATWVSQHALLNGSSQYITVGRTSELTFTSVDNFTFGCWVYWSGSASAYTCIGGTESASAGLTLLVKTDNTLAIYCSGGSACHIDGVGSALPTNAWSFVAATYDGITLKTYINGVVNSSTAAASYGDSGLGWRWGASEGFSRFLTGSLSDCFVYRTALTSTQLLDIFNFSGAPV